MFCEVRARRHDAWVAPHHTIDARKAARVRAAAARWLGEARLERPMGVRIDVASVVESEGGELELDYYEGAL